jgi:hypothetical protein
MTRSRRWAFVCVALALLIALPGVVADLPAGHSAVTADNLLALVKNSGDVRYSGFAESSGRLALPVTTQFNSISDLFGGSMQLRVWWRGETDWRVDTLALTGETDLHRDPAGTWVWDYESNTATRVPGAGEPSVRLPRADDLVPATLARRLLSQAHASEVTRLPNDRIAGHAAAGLRLRPGDTQSTIDHVDIWALPSSGLAVRVNIYGNADSRAVLTTSMLDLSTTVPAAAVTAFSPPAAAKQRFEQQPDIVAALDHLGRAHPPAELAGLPREKTAGLGSVGVYGRGVTLLVAVPLPPRLAGTLSRQVTGAVGATAVAEGTTLGVGPVNLLLTPRRNGSAWLLAGTITTPGLEKAAGELPIVEGFRR